MCESFIAESARYLEEIHLPRLVEATATLPQSDLWWRPHDGVISVGNILLHLEGNVRQWIICGVGGAEDHRQRPTEFATTKGLLADELLMRLSTTVVDACTTIRSLDREHLSKSHVIQGMDTTVLAALYHVVEHFSWHTGQAVWIAKARAGESHGLSFYDDSKL